MEATPAWRLRLGGRSALRPPVSGWADSRGAPGCVRVATHAANTGSREAAFTEGRASRCMWPQVQPGRDRTWLRAPPAHTVHRPPPG